MWSVEFPELKKLDFYLKPIPLLHLEYIWQLSQIAKNPFPLISCPLMCMLLLLKTTYNLPVCESLIVMPVMSGLSSDSQRHPALLFAQGQVH